MVEGLGTKLDRVAVRFNELPNDSYFDKARKGLYFIYVLEVGGSVFRKYQLQFAEGLGWKEKNLTIKNALLWALPQSLIAMGFTYAFEDRLNNPVELSSYVYNGLNVVQCLARAAHAQATGEAIGAIGISNAVGSGAYWIRDQVRSWKEKSEIKKSRSRSDLDEILK